MSHIVRELDDFWKESSSLQQQWWFQADLDTKMATGQQDYWGSFYNVNYRNQKMLMFNKILRIINMIGGYQRKNRLQTIAIPSDGNKDLGEVTDELTTVLNWAKRQDDTYEKISECFEGASICGLNLLNVWMDFREDPESGEIKTTRVPYNGFIMDPYWTKSDLSDCDRIWTRRYLTKRQLESIYPKISKELPFFNKGYASKDGKFQFLAQNWSTYQTEMYAYDEYWVRDYRKKRKLLDQATGEVIDWNGTKEQFALLKRYNPNVSLITTNSPTIKFHALVNNQVVYEEQAPFGLDRFPFVPFICYHFPEVQNYGYRYQGVVRNIRDSQVELNRRRNRLLDVLDAQIQSGLMVKEDALVNPEDAFFQGPGKILFFKNSANLASDVAPIPPPPVAQGWPELIQSLDNEIMSIVGTPEELFGEDMSAKDMSGVLFQAKMGAALVGLQGIFDRLNQSQKALGDIFIELIQKNYTAGKVEQILGKPASLNFDHWWETKYTTAVEEAELTSTQRQLQFLQAIQLKQMGINIPDDYILEKSTLQGKKEVIEKVKAQQEQMAQMQMQQAQAEMQNTQVLSRSLEAKAQKDLASAEKEKADAVHFIALAKQEASVAVEKRSAAALENIKAIKEIEGMDEDRLVSLVDFVVGLQERHKALEGDEESDSKEVASSLGQSVKSDAASRSQ